MSIRKFRVEDEAKWEHQNRAEYMGDFVEGVLLDSYMLACKRGYCAVYARSHSAGWSSWHEYRFAAYKDKEACDELWREWREFEEAAEKAWSEYEEWMEGRCA